MSIILSDECTYVAAPFLKEAELEESILKIQSKLFGTHGIYLNAKKMIGNKGKDGIKNIPDGYLIDLASEPPQLYTVENELSKHSISKHIIPQIYSFNTAFKKDQRLVKNILLKEITKNSKSLQLCKNYVRNSKFSSIDQLFDYLVFDGDFAALVIIDEITRKFEDYIAGPHPIIIKTLEIARYKNNRGEYIHRFKPFLEKAAHNNGKIKRFDRPTAASNKNNIDYDTIVIPARTEGFERVFLGENRWYEIRIKKSRHSQIKYIAAYQVAPISAITHIAKVKTIQPWANSGKCVINFSSPAKKIQPIIWNNKGQTKAPQAPRYTFSDKISSAKTLDDIW